ncbi:1327_t:CDS:2, partial [Cetraspora pellucida]
KLPTTTQTNPKEGIVTEWTSQIEQSFTQMQLRKDIQQVEQKLSYTNPQKRMKEVSEKLHMNLNPKKDLIGLKVYLKELQIVLKNYEFQIESQKNQEQLFKEIQEAYNVKYALENIGNINIDTVQMQYVTSVKEKDTPTRTV